MANSQARDGRQSLAFIGGTPTAATTVAVGDFVIVTGKAASESAFGNIPLMSPFFVTKATTLKSGDTCVKVPLLFLGQATGKSLSYSKNIVDVTIDYDESTNNVTDGQVSQSGSISGANITESLSTSTTSGVNELKKRFVPITQIDGDTITYEAANTTEKDLLVIGWNLRNAKDGDLVEFSVVPAIFSNLSIGGEYGSSQSFDVDYTGNYTDENNYKGGNLQVKVTTAFLSAAFKRERPTA